MNSNPGANNAELPVITIFGAGIAGMTAAHELVERGFRVQVVECQESDFEEYECAVGGLAANQFARVRAPIDGLHPWLMTPDASDLRRSVEEFRNERQLEQTSDRFPLRQRIRFNKRVHDPKGPAPPPPDYDVVPPTPLEPGEEIPPDWRDYWDDHGTRNRLKLGDVLARIREAGRTHMGLYFPAVALRLALDMPPTDEELRTGFLGGTRFSPIQGDAERGRSFLVRETLVVQIIGYTDTDGTAEDNRRLANAWATSVRDELIALNNAAPADLRIWELKRQLDIVIRGSANPQYDQSTATGRDQSNRVEFQVVEQVIPGEHGFRFFPAFYRHLFDTMRRTPLLDPLGNNTGRTAFDQLVPTPRSFLSRDDGTGPQVVEFQRFRSLRQFDDTLKMLLDELGFTTRDLIGLQVYFMRYLTSSAGRRQEEAEAISLLKYLGGSDPSKRFSKAALDFINGAPRALAAMSATESDARTQFDITVQLMTAQFEAGGSDMTLNGPTSIAWLEHWKTYLRVQGVRFFVGQINSLELLGDRLVPKIAGPDGLEEPRPENAYDPYLRPSKESELDNHRFILAVSFQRASDLVWDAFNTVVAGNAFTGPFRQLVEFDLGAGRRRIGDRAAYGPRRDPKTGGPLNPLYPLRDISGLQYFFPQEYRFSEGNVYFVSAPWALTSISQFAYWRERIRPVGEYLGQISVDVGDWHAFYPPGETATGPHGNTAWYSSCQEVAASTWRQIKDGLATDYARVINEPRYFHIDRNIVFGDFAHLGFRGSALLHITRPSIMARPAIADLVTFTVSSGKWSRYQTGPIVLPLKSPSVGPDGPEISAEFLAARINELHDGEFLFATPHCGSATDVLVSPKAVGTEFVIGFRSRSSSLSYIAVDQKWQTFTVVDKKQQRVDVLRAATDALGRQLDTTLEVKPLDPKGDSTFLLKRTDGKKFRATVANVDGAVELVDGPRLDVQTDSQRLWLINPMHPGSSRVTHGAVRANAVLRLPPLGRDESDIGVQPGRLYGVALAVGAGDADTIVKYEAKPEETPQQLRDGLLQQLNDQARKVVLFEPMPEPQPPQANPVGRGAGRGTARPAPRQQRRRDDASAAGRVAAPGILVSPIVDVSAALIRVTAKSERQFRVKIDGQDITVDGRGRTAAQALTAIAEETQARLDYIDVGPVADGSLPLTLRPNHGDRTFKIAVINADRAIELTGAPALTIEVKDLHLEEPAEGFVVLRNDAEFLINVPGEWQERPGLFRPPARIPDQYASLAACFGDKKPEIFYGHDDCPLLKCWVPAGTYMATYTRITTMEAANESGRHAAAAIISSLFPAGGGAGLVKPQHPVLVGDFPMIWKVEDYEPEDLKFFTDLDQELFASDLPHVFDILSITPLVNALLEMDLKEDQLRPFLQRLNTIFDKLKLSAHLSIMAGGQAFSALIDAHRDLTQAILGTIRGNDPVSAFTSGFLSDRLNEMSQLAEYYRHLWFRPDGQKR